MSDTHACELQLPHQQSIYPCSTPGVLLTQRSCQGRIRIGSQEASGWDPSRLPCRPIPPYPASCDPFLPHPSHPIYLAKSPPPHAIPLGVNQVLHSIPLHIISHIISSQHLHSMPVMIEGAHGSHPIHSRSHRQQDPDHCSRAQSSRAVLRQAATRLTQYLHGEAGTEASGDASFRCNVRPKLVQRAGIARASISCASEKVRSCLEIGVDTYVYVQMYMYI